MTLERAFVGLGILALMTCWGGVFNASSMNENWSDINDVLWKVFYAEIFGLVLLFAFAYWRNR